MGLIIGLKKIRHLKNYLAVNGKLFQEDFLFSTDSNHSVDSTGGEEKHTLIENEMPSHTHGYNHINYNSYYTFDSIPGSGKSLPYRSDTNWYRSNNVDYKGGNQPHNNMPPYITAYCWRRYR